MQELSQKIHEISQFLKSKITHHPKLGIILGSGLGDYAKDIKDAIIIPYHEIPHVPKASAPGHAGNLIFGYINNQYIMAMQGRLHLYEGHSPHIATILIRAMKLLGIDYLIISCAAGGLNPKFHAGDIMLITDHINLTAQNPLMGPNLDEFGPRFPIMFDIYSKLLGKKIQEIALTEKIFLQSGVYVGYTGPYYCTRAELKYFSQIGGDVVAMSLVHEAIAAAHAGLNILAIAAVTDMALYYSDHHANEEEIIVSGKQITAKFKLLVDKFIEQVN